MNNEPVITIGTISLIVSALLTLLVSFGVPITDQQVESILQFVAAVAPLVVGYLIARGKVTATDRLKRHGIHAGRNEIWADEFYAREHAEFQRQQDRR